MVDNKSQGKHVFQIGKEVLTSMHSASNLKDLSVKIRTTDLGSNYTNLR